MNRVLSSNLRAAVGDEMKVVSVTTVCNAKRISSKDTGVEQLHCLHLHCREAEHMAVTGGCGIPQVIWSMALFAAKRTAVMTLGLSLGLHEGNSECGTMAGCIRRGPTCCCLATAWFPVESESAPPNWRQGVVKSSGPQHSITVGVFGLWSCAKRLSAMPSAQVYTSSTPSIPRPRLTAVSPLSEVAGAQWKRGDSIALVYSSVWTSNKAATVASRDGLPLLASI